MSRSEWSMQLVELVILLQDAELSPPYFLYHGSPAWILDHRAAGFIEGFHTSRDI